VDFKLIVEEALNEHGDVYTLDEITRGNPTPYVGGYITLEAGARSMDIIQRHLRRGGYYKLGVRGVVIDIEPRNEIEQKAREIFKENPNLDFFKIQSVLNGWIEANLSKERVKEIQKEFETKRFRDPVYTAVKLVFFGLIIIPYKKAETDKDYEERKEFTNKIYEEFRDLGIAPRNYHGLQLRSAMEEIGVSRFKVYKEYDLDKETEQAWGDIASEL
jgi:hypothetical protein